MPERQEINEVSLQLSQATVQDGKIWVFEEVGLRHPGRRGVGSTEQISGKENVRETAENSCDLPRVLPPRSHLSTACV